MRARRRIHSPSSHAYDASVTTDFERENRLPDEDLDMWAHFIEEETAGS